MSIKTLHNAVAAIAQDDVAVTVSVTFLRTHFARQGGLICSGIRKLKGLDLTAFKGIGVTVETSSAKWPSLSAPLILDSAEVAIGPFEFDLIFHASKDPSRWVSKVAVSISMLRAKPTYASNKFLWAQVSCEGQSAVTAKDSDANRQAVFAANGWDAAKIAAFEAYETSFSPASLKELGDILIAGLQAPSLLSCFETLAFPPNLIFDSVGSGGDSALVIRGASPIELKPPNCPEECVCNHDNVSAKIEGGVTDTDHVVSLSFASEAPKPWLKTNKEVLIAAYLPKPALASIVSVDVIENAVVPKLRFSGGGAFGPFSLFDYAYDVQFSMKRDPAGNPAFALTVDETIPALVVEMALNYHGTFGITQTTGCVTIDLASGSLHGTVDSLRIKIYPGLEDGAKLVFFAEILDCRAGDIHVDMGPVGAVINWPISEVVGYILERIANAQLPKLVNMVTNLGRFKLADFGLSGLLDRSSKPLKLLCGVNFDNAAGVFAGFKFDE